MAKAHARYVCQSCGAATTRWSGRCEGCGGWNTVTEEAPRESAPGGLGAGGRRRGRPIDFAGMDGPADSAPRRACGIAEFDRVCGGGLVPGSAILIGGDPGIGKSTLLMQVAAALASPTAPGGGNGGGCLYISGEEAVDQLRLRARRLGLSRAPVLLAAATAVRDITANLDTAEAPGIVVI
ncbi:MAG TPA: AAA family ATPase, partial [Kiloniellales bacterium]